MTLDQLNYLLVLAEEQNVTRAAQRLYITQPTLTTFITKLERELGTKLFDRSRNPVRPTKNGELYLKKMQELLLAEQQLKEELRYQDSGRRRLRIGLGYGHSAMWAADLSQRLLELYPELDIRFCEGQEAKMMDALRKDEIDVFFGHAEIDPVNFTFGELFEERILLLLPRDFLPELPDGAGCVPEQPYLMDASVLEGRRMIVPGNAMGLNLNVQLLWKRFNISPPALIQTNNTISGIQMAARGLGYVMANEELVRFVPSTEQDNLVFCTLPGMSQQRKYYYGYAESNPDRELVLRTIEIMKAMAAGEETI